MASGKSRRQTRLDSILCVSKGRAAVQLGELKGRNNSDVGQKAPPSLLQLDSSCPAQPPLTRQSTTTLRAVGTSKEERQCTKRPSVPSLLLRRRLRQQSSDGQSATRPRQTIARSERIQSTVESPRSIADRCTVAQSTTEKRQSFTDFPLCASTPLSSRSRR